MRAHSSYLSVTLALVGAVALTHCGRDALTGAEHPDAGEGGTHGSSSGSSSTATSSGAIVLSTSSSSNAGSSGRGASTASSSATSSSGHSSSSGHASSSSGESSSASTASSSSGESSSSGSSHSSSSSGSSGSSGDLDGGGDVGPTPARGGVSLDGGAVDRLFFTFTGDTRPPICDLYLLGNNDYPSASVTKVAEQMEAQQSQFSLDLGDHVFVCIGGAHEAQEQMTDYLTAIANFHAPFFMTMGNHECAFALGGALGDCGANNTSDPVYQTFLAALAPISATPYYFRDITTSMGLVRMVFIADDAWNSTEQSWLEATLTEADTLARYTIISNHHNLAASTSGDYETIVQTINAHKFALHLTAHTHTYIHDLANDPTGRTVIVGVGGATDATSPALGYASVIQGLDGRLYVTMYDSSTNLPIDTWSVGPNQ